jgi:hypothetical protein
VLPSRLILLDINFSLVPGPLLLLKQEHAYGSDENPSKMQILVGLEFFICNKPRSEAAAVSVATLREKIP